MSFNEKLYRQQLDAERDRQRKSDQERNKNEERLAQDQINYKEWYKNDFLPVWRNWERLGVDKKIEAIRYPFSNYHLVIFQKNRTTHPSKTETGFSWKNLDYWIFQPARLYPSYDHRHPTTSAITGYVYRSQDSRFSVGGFFRASDFSFSRVLVQPAPDDAVRLGVRITSEEIYDAGSGHNYKKSIEVKVDKGSIVISGNETVRLETGVSVGEFDNALLAAVKNFQSCTS